MFNLTHSMTTSELLVILFVGSLFLCALAYIAIEEKEEADIFKNWEKWK